MSSPGKVYLVGAGPGDPGLLTLKGLACLQQAELVLYDGLVNPLLLEHTPATAERTRRSGGPGEKLLDQEEINHRLITEARAGRGVVRLKGGDPFLFGRGAEEARALAEAGIPFEVVPGITAATASTAYAGIPLTHRLKSSAVAFVTGHEDPAKPAQSIDYSALAAFPGTLVFYMGLHRVGEICAALIEAGLDQTTPAAVISRGTCSSQQTVSATLKTLAEAVIDAELSAPSLIVVGDCVSERQSIAWFEQRPLLGRAIGITRPAAQAAGTIERILQLGAEPVLMPTISIEPPEDSSTVDAVIERLEEFQWIVFTSANGVAGLLGRLWDSGGDARRLGQARLAAIGPATASALQRYGLRADVVPAAFRAEELAAVLADQVQGTRVLWARASRGRDILPRVLADAGAEVEQLVVYQNLDVEAWPVEVAERIRSGSLDWIGLSSPSIAENVARLQPGPARLASISPVTSAAAVEAGLTVSAEATSYTWDGLLTAIVESERSTDAV